MGKKKQHYMTEPERHQLEALYNARIPVARIAGQLGFCRSTIYNELRRGEYMHNVEYAYERRYSAQKGQLITARRQSNKGGQLKIGSDIAYARFLEEKIIRERFSPAAALAEARKAGFATSICVSTLYSYIDKGIFLHLGNQHLWVKAGRLRKAQAPAKRVTHPKLPSIEQRPVHVNDRSEPGHWEMDLVVSGTGGAGALLSMTERVSRLVYLRYMPDKKAATVRGELAKLRRRGAVLRSITTDNGPEFLEYDKLRTTAGCEIYYCHSYSAWEKGQVENQNRMIRRFFPKGTDFGKVPKSELKRLENWLNDYPRKSLGWLSAREAASVVLDCSS